MTKLLSFAAMTLTLIAPASFTGQVSADELKVGDTAPDFQLPGSDGQIYKLSDLTKEQTVVLAWFPKAFTGGCTAECKSMRDSGEALAKYDVAYFTASCDTPETNKKFAESLDLNFPILSDPTCDTAKAYGVVDADRPRPHRWTFFIGPENKILHIEKNVKTASHGADIAAQLETLGVK